MLIQVEFLSLLMWYQWMTFLKKASFLFNVFLSIEIMEYFEKLMQSYVVENEICNIQAYLYPWK